MVQINFAAREVNCKVVYYGPALSGKTTNLEVLYQKAPKDSTGELVTIATETDRTLFFDFLPLDLGLIAGMRTKLQVYTVPGQVIYKVTRKLVLQGADGVIFVADSNPDVRDDNVNSLEDLDDNLQENGLNLADLPLVFQYNKRDLPNALPVEALNGDLNPSNVPFFEAVAVKGKGVGPTLVAVSNLVIKKLNREQGYSEDGKMRLAASRAPRPSPQAAPAPRPVAAPPRPAAPPPRPAAPPPRPVATPGGARPMPRPVPRPVPRAIPRPGPAAPGQRPVPRPAPRAAPGPPAPRPMPQPAPRPAGGPAPRPRAPAAPGASGFRDELRKRKEMEAQRAGQGPGRPLQLGQAKRPGSVGLPVIIAVVVALLAAVVVVLKFGFNAF